MNTYIFTREYKGEQWPTKNNSFCRLNGCAGQFAAEQKKKLPKFQEAEESQFWYPKSAIYGPPRLPAGTDLGNFTTYFPLKMIKKYVRVDWNPRHSFLKLIGTMRTHLRAQKYFESDI